MTPKQYLMPERRPKRPIPEHHIDDEFNTSPDISQAHEYSLAPRNGEVPRCPIAGPSPVRSGGLRDSSDSRLYDRHASQDVNIGRSNVYTPSPDVSNDEKLGNALANANHVARGRSELPPEENYFYPTHDQQRHRLNVSIPSSSSHGQVYYTPSPQHQRNITTSPAITQTYSHALYPVAANCNADQARDSIRDFNSYSDSRYEFNTRIHYDESSGSQVGNSGPPRLGTHSPAVYSFAIPIRPQDPPSDVPIYQGGAYSQGENHISGQYIRTDTPYSSTGSYPLVNRTLAESEKPGHDPQTPKYPRRRRRKPPSGNSISSVTLPWDTDTYLNGPRNIGVFDELRYPRNGFNDTGSHSGAGSTGFIDNRFYQDKQVAVHTINSMAPNPANFAGSSDIPISQIPNPEPYEALKASFLSFILSKENHYLLVDLPTAVAMEDLKTSYWRRMCHPSPYKESLDRLVENFQAIVGSPRNRADRDKKQKVDKNEIQKRCPISLCKGRFTRSNGLKNHLASHFKLTLKHCPTCNKGLTLSSFRRHVKSHIQNGDNQR